MKVINESAYKFTGYIIDDEGVRWAKFVSQPKPKFDVEILLVQRARFVRLDGTYQFIEPLLAV